MKPKKNLQRHSWLLKKLEFHLTSGQIMVVGFAALILLGSILLTLPVCNADGKWLAYIDALFTACSAVCVTGLVTIVPAVQFTLPGKVILLILIQLGGLGIIACTMGFALLFRRQITMRERILISESYDLETMTGIVRMIRYVICGTFVVEGIGAVGYAFSFVPAFGWGRGLWYAVFHSISTFCNAGIDILGDNSLAAYVTDPLVNTVAILLIFVSGLGFLVWQDLWKLFRVLLHREKTFSRAVHSLHLHTKLTMAVTFILLFGGAFLILLLEADNPDTLGNLTALQKGQAALFQSATTRTAGFFTIPQNLFRSGTQLFCCILMFIGGSPGGTAGGVKTTTAAALLMVGWSVLRGKEDTECFGRRIPAATIRTAFSVVLVSFITLLTGTMLLLILEPVSLSDALYEVTSAVATVGLTAGITPQLHIGGKLVIIVLMYLGRLSPVTIAILFASRSKKRNEKRTLPDERILVG